jgi:hypothetical protein
MYQHSNTHSPRHLLLLLCCGAVPDTPLCTPTFFAAVALRLLFLTQPQGVNEVAAIMMRGDYVSVNTVLDDERPSHESITQV